MNKQQLEKLLKKKDAPLMVKVKAHHRYLIEEAMEDKEIVNVCCVTGLVKTYDCDGEYIKYELKEPYDRISHGYCPAEYEKIMEEISQMEDLSKVNLRHK